MARTLQPNCDGPGHTDVSRYIYLLVFALVVVGVAIFGITAYRQHQADVLQRLVAEHESAVQFQGGRLQRAAEALRNDTLFLSRTPPLRGIMRAAGNGGMDPLEHNSMEVWAKRLQEIFAAFLYTRPEYFQARYIGVADGGRELVRVERSGGGVVVVTAAELQRKGGRDYFQAGLGLAEGEVYLSDFNLNREYGGIAVPRMQTLRAVTPVYDNRGRVFGLVVVNMDVGNVMREIASRAVQDGAVYVTDQQGRYLVHPDAALAFTFELGNTHRLQSDFPDLAALLKDSSVEPGTPATRLYRMDREMHYVAARRVHFDPARPERFVLLAQAMPETVLEQEADSYRLQVILGGLLALVLILPALFLLLRAIMAPLRQLGLAAEQMSLGNYEVVLPAAGAGEIGMLVQGFEHMRAQVALREQELKAHNAVLAREVSQGVMDLRLAGSVVENTSEGVMVTDSKAHILSINPAFTEITGYSAGEAIGSTPRLIRSDHHDAAFYKAIWEQLLDCGHWQGEIWNRRKSGEVYLEWLTINRIAGATSDEDRYVAVFTDVTELRRKDERIHHLAFHDPLTGLPNRALVHDRLQHAVSLADRRHSRTGVMLIDLDRFKAVNDGLGHDVGDLLLKEVAGRLTACLRQTDTAARMGGDEFLVILENVDEPEYCAGLAEHIIDTISEPIDILGRHIQVGASVGIAFHPGDGNEVADLIKHADVAMYAAKADGKGVFRFFRPDMTERATRFLNLEMELRHGIANGELELYYQPKLSLRSGALQGVEALVRWRHPQRGLVPPVDFITVAEESGLIVDLGEWVLDEACRQAALWQGRLGSIAVNVSARQFDKIDLVERILELTGRHGIAPSCIQIELTESTVMKDPERVIVLLGRVRELGITVAVDDFGTGYSSLSYLRRLPIDLLKIDRSFVLNAGVNEEDTQIARTIIALGQALHMAVVAEGVETPAQAELLREMGCNMGQGYLYAKPQPAADLERWLADWPAGTNDRRNHN